MIKTPTNKTVLIDGGDEDKNRTLLPYLLDRRITKIDYLIPSHMDSDHVKGLINVAKELEIKNMILTPQSETSENLNVIMTIAKSKNIKIITVKRGDTLKFDEDVSIGILWPDPKNLIEENPLNNNSLVAKLKYKTFSMLFTGDIEEIAEESICRGSNLLPETLQSNILKIAHHGSKTSTTDEFLNMVNPKIALIGVGKNNRFNHPSDVTINKLNKRNTKIYRTDQDGEIEITVKQNMQLNIVAKLRKEASKI